MPELPTDHRPWPLPSRPWAMSMTWRDLAFLHWPVRQDAIRPLIPSQLEIDTWDGSAWLGVVPFAMEAVCPRFTPRIPQISDFPELNVRTYVTAGGKPGVFFFSLDAASRLGVRMARRFFHLPYFDARIDCQLDGETVHYRSDRFHRGAPAARFVADYRPNAPISPTTEGTVEHWLTERYCLYSASARGEVFRGDVHHQPWPLQTAEVEIQENTLGEQIGVPLSGPPVFSHFARNIYVLAWLIEPVK